jgi:hypothetical protein
VSSESWDKSHGYLQEIANAIQNTPPLTQPPARNFAKYSEEFGFTAFLRPRPKIIP